MCLRCLLHHILLLIAYTFRENREIVFIIIVQFIISANKRIRFVLKIVYVCLYITPPHYHHCANISEDIELVKCLSDIFCRVCEQDRAYSLHYTIRGAVCFQFTHFPCDDWDNIYSLSYYHHQIGIMHNCPFLELGNETMVCAVCLSVFFWPRAKYGHVEILLLEILFLWHLVPLTDFNKSQPMFQSVHDDARLTLGKNHGINHRKYIILHIEAHQARCFLITVWRRCDFNKNVHNTHLPIPEVGREMVN